MFSTQTYAKGINFLVSKNCFSPSFSTSSTMFSKIFPLWIVKTRDCLVLKLTREVSISSSAKKKCFLTTIILSFLYNVFKNLTFLDRQNSELFVTQTYARGINFLLSKKNYDLDMPVWSIWSKTCFQ